MDDSMAIEENISNILRKIDNHIQKAEELERDGWGKNKDKAKALKESLIEIKQSVEQLREETKCKIEHSGVESREVHDEHAQVKISNENLRKRVTKLENELLKSDETIQKLHKEVQNLRAITNTLEIGQIAFEFENVLATYVYPSDKKIGSRKIFARMEEWLEKKRETPQGREANEKWESLKRKVSWSRQHEEVLQKLKDARKGYAHPHVDMKVVGTDIFKQLFNEGERNAIQDIIDIIQEVNDLIDYEK